MYVLYVFKKRPFNCTRPYDEALVFSCLSFFLNEK